MINRLNFSIDIRAEKEKIWHALWNENFYRDWVSVFTEGSYAVTDYWKEGSTVQFLSPDQSGIYSLIETHIPKTIMVFRHIGTVVKGQAQPVDEESQKWTGATERYTLTEGKDTNRLTVDIDVMDEHVTFMTEKMPKALERIRDNSYQ